MNYTREPIIETIITPKEGCKLTVRSSKSEGQEEFTVDAVEVVSFGQALFFRSQERPRPFLVPVGDYEVLEVKETRVVLKNASFDRTIKIGGGREAPVRREERSEEEPSSEPAEESSTAEGPVQERRHGRRRHRRRRSHEDREDVRQRVNEAPNSPLPEESVPTEEAAPQAEEPAPESANIFGHLIPPPTSLISEKFHRKHSENVPPEESALEEKKEDTSGESNPLNRVSTEAASTFLSSGATGWTHFIS